MSDIPDLETKNAITFTLRVITSTSVSRFKRFFAGCASLLDELVLSVDADGLRIRQPDSLNTAFVDCTFSPRFFRGVLFNSDKTPIQLSLDPREFMTGFQQASKAIMLTFSEAESDTLRIKAVGKSTVSNHIKVLQISQSQRTPSFDITGSFAVTMKTFYETLNPFKNRASVVKMTLRQGFGSNHHSVSFEMFTDDDMISSETLHNSDRIWNAESKEPLTEANYDIGYLLKGLSLFTPDDRITVSFAGNKPLTFSSSGLDGRKINFTIAPRVPRG